MRLTLLGLSIVLLAAGCQKSPTMSTDYQPYDSSYSNSTGGDSSYSWMNDSASTTPATTTYDTASYDSTPGYSDQPLTPIGGSQTYTVRKGDTLYALARRFYSDQGRWREIWQANRGRVGNPDQIYVGMKLVIP